MVAKTETAREIDEDLWIRSKYGKLIQGAFKLLDEEAEKQLAAADEAYSGADYLVALRGYMSIRKAMLPRDAGKAADRRLKSAEKSPDVKMAMREAKAQSLYACVARLLKVQRNHVSRTFSANVEDGQAAPGSGPTSDANLVKRMKITDQARVFAQLTTLAKHHAGTPTGDKSAALLKQLRSDKKLLAAIRSHETDKKVRDRFNKARMYEKAKMYKKAKQYYREFITKYPDGEYANEARRRLKSLNGRG